MTVEPEINVLSEVAEAAYLLNDLETYQKKLHTARAKFAQVAENLKGLHDLTATQFHYLTTKLVDDGRDLSSDDPELRQILSQLNQVKEALRGLKDDICEPFNEIGDVIDFWK